MIRKFIDEHRKLERTISREKNVKQDEERGEFFILHITITSIFMNNMNNFFVIH